VLLSAVAELSELMDYRREKRESNDILIADLKRLTGRLALIERELDA
jgi:hypothetical protein